MRKAIKYAVRAVVWTILCLPILALSYASIWVLSALWS